MKVTVFGANGRVGKLVVERLLNKGHEVTAIVHSFDPFAGDPLLSVIEGDIYNAHVVNTVVTGSDVIISTLGSWGTPRKDVLSSGMANIIPAMQSSGVRRIISLTGHEARAQGDKPGIINLFAHTALSLLAGKILRDGEEHIRLLEQSGLDWTVLRSPVMSEKGSREYELVRRIPTPWATIHRHAVAQAIVDQVDSKAFLKASPFLVRK